MRSARAGGVTVPYLMPITGKTLATRWGKCNKTQNFARLVAEWQNWMLILGKGKEERSSDEVLA